jgi:hypothetical protein|tara:strand:+ start:219 stop:500 length:282 start_codon:yes stop_codon:yes gene_type:complete
MNDEMMDFEDEMYSEQEQEMMRDQMKDALARKNFEAVDSGDVDFSNFYGKDNQKDIEKTLCDMLEHFTESEEYENCTIILKALNEVKGTFKTV